MKRYCLLAVLILLSPSAYAGNSISFVVGGHRIHIEASRHCRSTSCASVSISGIYRSRDRYDDDDRYEDDRIDNGPAKPQPAPPTIAPSAPPVSKPPAPPLVVASPPPSVYKPAAAATRIVTALPPLPPVAPTTLAVPPAPPSPPPPSLPPVAKPVEPVRPAPQISRVSHALEEDADTPIGDWQTEGKGSVRIGKCGNALCGYVLNSSSNDKGEAVLINMKPKTDTQWGGSVYSRSSGDTYYGTMDLKGANTLRVEACALGRFYCSGNNWSRITDRPESLISSRQTSAEPRS
jgi:hypothetical protein